MKLSSLNPFKKAAATPTTGPVAASVPAQPTTTGSPFAGFGGSSRSWKSEAGPVQNNSAVSICLSMVANNFADAVFCVRKHDGNGAYSIDPSHPVARLLKRPNPFWSRTQLFRAIIISLFLDGNCYLYKAKNGMGEVVELYWLAHNAMKVETDKAGYITNYKFKPAGGAEENYHPDEIIHLKQGVNLAKPCMGESPLLAVLREIATDNEILSYTYAILKNMGVPCAILSPKSLNTSGDSESETIVTIPKGLTGTIKQLFKNLTGGDNRGEPLVLDTPWDIEFPGFKPRELMLDSMGEMAEVRIAAAFGVPVVVVQFLSGLKNTNAKASYQESIQQLYGCCLIPLQRLICEWFDLQLLPELGDIESEHCYFDRSEVQALQESQNEKTARADAGYSAGVLKRSEARTAHNLQSDNSDDVYIQDVQAAASMGSLLGVPSAGIDPTDETANEGLKTYLRGQWKKRGVGQ